MLLRQEQVPVVKPAFATEALKASSVAKAGDLVATDKLIRRKRYIVRQIVYKKDR